MIALRARKHRDPAEFAALVRPWLAADPVRHTLALTSLQSVERAVRQPAALLTVHDVDGNLAGAALRAQHRPLIVSALPAHCAPVAVQALEELDPPPGVTGPTAEVDAVVAAVGRLRGGRARVVHRIRLFALSELRPPHGVPGGARFAGGSAITAAVTAHALEVGARHVLLFTDLANPVSNAIYPRIGYLPVHDGLEVAFLRQDGQV